MNITMIGAGYVGLVTGACLAEFGHYVCCFDIDEQKIDALNIGEMPIYEDGLDVLVHKNVDEKRLVFSSELEESVSVADVIFIAVGTPSSRRGDGYADLSFVYTAAKNLAKYLHGYTVVVDKSTVPVGTARQVFRIIAATNPNADFDIVSNPEFLREGAAIEDFMRPDRVVIGAETQKAFEVMKEVYNPLFLQSTPIVETTLESAELIKYSANAFLATKISYINEIANLCEAVGADIMDVSRGMGMDGRIGGKFLHPGPGYGGSCFPKDTLALLRIAQEVGKDLKIVSATVSVNSAQKALMVKKIKSAIGDSLEGKVITVLGLTFKPNTDDMRESASVTIVPALMEKGATIMAHDPKGVKEARKLLPKGVQYMTDAYSAAQDADCIVLMTEWSQYRAMNMAKIIKNMKDNPVFVDLRNVYKKEKMEELGFKYVGNGQV